MAPRQWFDDEPQRRLTQENTMTDISQARVTTGTARHDGRRPRRLSTETKSAFLTTEFWMYLAAVAGVLIASLLVKSADGHADYFRADRAWLLIVVLTVGYMISRGLS